MNKFTLTVVATAFSAILMGCGDGADSSESTVPAPTPTASNTSSPDATCVPNEQKDCQCKDGAEGKQACAKDGKSYSECICIAKPDAGADSEAPVTCGPMDRPVGYVIGSNCCPDGGTGYMVCQLSGEFEGCYGCPLEQPDAGNDAAKEPVLTVDMNPLPGLQAEFGTKRSHLFNAVLCSASNLEIILYEFVLQGQNGSIIVGSQGTKYFSNLKVVDDDGNPVTLSGPKELTSPANSTSEAMPFTDSFSVNNTCRHVALVADLSDYEDALNELGGKTFTISHTRVEARYAGTYQQVAAESIMLNAGQTQLTVKAAQPTDALKAVLSGATPPSGIRIAGKANDAAFTTYTVTNTANVPIVFDHINVQAISADGFSGPEYISLFWAQIKNFKMISSGAIDQVGATQIGPVSNGDSVTLDPGESTDLHIGASLQGAMPTSIPDQPGLKQPRSGGQLRLQMYALYKGTHQVVGMAGPESPNLMVVRKSKPIVSKVQVASNVLANIDSELIKLQIAADPQAPVAIKSLKFNVAKAGSFKVTGFKLYRNSSMVPIDEYDIVLDGTMFPSDLTMSPDIFQSNVIITFKNEDVINGQGNVYSLRATVTGANYACAVTTSLLGKSQDTQVVTGKVFAYYPTYLSITGVSPDSMAQFFIWSDMSELPHSAQMDGWTGNPVSSADWTNGFMVQTLEISQTLSN